LVDGKFPISKLTITKSLRAEYKTPTPPAHKVLAERIGVRDPGNKPSTTERIPYVYIPAPANLTSQGDRIETPTFIKENNIIPDYAFYITNQIAKPVAQVFGLVVEKLPGVKKADIQRINAIDNPSKRTDAREALASELLFGAILSKINKERKESATKKKIIDEKQARSQFMDLFKNKSK
jgi:DNA polymerase elongation subunit (family B)